MPLSEKLIVKILFYCNTLLGMLHQQMQSRTPGLQSGYNSYSYKFIVITLVAKLVQAEFRIPNAKLVFIPMEICSLLLVVANVTIGKTNE